MQSPRLPYWLIVPAAFVVLSALSIVQLGPKMSLILLVVPPGLYLLTRWFINPVQMIYGALIASFLISLLGRYVPGIPFGLSVDGLFFILTLALVFHRKFDSNIEGVA